MELDATGIINPNQKDKSILLISAKEQRNEYNGIQGAEKTMSTICNTMNTIDWMLKLRRWYHPLHL